MTPEAPRVLSCASCQTLLESLRVARWYLVTAHDSNQPYVTAALARVDSAIAQAERQP